MKIDFKQVLKNFDGNDVLGGHMSPETLARAFATLDKDTRAKVLAAIEAEKLRPITLKIACCEALAGDYAHERDERGVATVEAAERMRRFRLGMLIATKKDGVVDIDQDHKDLLKKLLPNAYGGVIVAMQACEMLDGAKPGES